MTTRNLIGTLLWMLLTNCIGCAQPEKATSETHSVPPKEVTAETHPVPIENCASPGTGARYEGYMKVILARNQLKDYEVFMQVIDESDYTYPIFFDLTNHYRADVIDSAIQAYYLCGPIDYAVDDMKLMETVLSPTLEYPFYEWPSSLDVLVDSGLLPYLPKSPFGETRWVDDVPSNGYQPGDVFYRTYPMEHVGYFLLEPGGLENFLFFIIGRPGKLVMDEKRIQRKFIGNLEEVLPDPPDNIVCFMGQQYEDEEVVDEEEVLDIEPPSE